jgi:hypothetical protein
MRQPATKATTRGEALEITKVDSGMRPVSPQRALPSADEALPRLQSAPDRDGSSTTLMTAVVSELARLSQLASVPELSCPLGREIEMTPAEAYVASLMSRDTDLATLLQMSPLQEEETLRFLARLITHGLLVLR